MARGANTSESCRPQGLASSRTVPPRAADPAAAHDLIGAWARTQGPGRPYCTPPDSALSARPPARTVDTQSERRRAMVEPGNAAAGVDTHKRAHALAVVDAAGRTVFEGVFPADAAGYDELARAIGPAGGCGPVGVEGASSYGAGLARRLAELGYEVVEVLRPGRPRRRPGQDKNDLADAARAARQALSREGCSVPKAGACWAERLRCLEVAREQLTRAATAQVNCAKALALTAPEPIRAALSGLRGARFMAAKLAVAAGGNPERLGGEAAFAALCGASPVDCSSGERTRRRLNRGGDRQANRALTVIVNSRARTDPRTRACIERRRREGKTTREAKRCLKRYVAREAYRAIMSPMGSGPAPDGAGLRAARESLGMTQAEVAAMLGASQSKVSAVERSADCTPELARSYAGLLDGLKKENRA